MRNQTCGVFRNPAGLIYYKELIMQLSKAGSLIFIAGIMRNQTCGFSETP